MNKFTIVTLNVRGDLVIGSADSSTLEKQDKATQTTAAAEQVEVSTSTSFPVAEVGPVAAKVTSSAKRRKVNTIHPPWHQEPEACRCSANCQFLFYDHHGKC